MQMIHSFAVHAFTYRLVTHLTYTGYGLSANLCMPMRTGRDNLMQLSHAGRDNLMQLPHARRGDAGPEALHDCLSLLGSGL